MSNHILVERIKEEMARSGLNARELAKRACVGDSFVYDVLSGKSRNPTTRKIAAIAEELGVSVPYLLDKNIHTRTFEHDYVAVPMLEFEPSYSEVPAISEKLGTKKFYFRKDWVNSSLKTSPSDLRVVKVLGDAMSPTLQHKDLVLIDLSKKNPSPSGLFAIAELLAITIKRVESVVSDGVPLIKLHSDNDNYSSYEQKIEDIHILGRVVWFSREI